MTTAQEYMNESGKHLKAADESFERCDTDGFVTQWARGVNAQLARAKAELIENGGVATFPALFEIETGRRIDAKEIDGRFGVCWLLSDDADAEKFGRFVPVDDSHRDDDEIAALKKQGIRCSRSRKQKQLGLIQKLEERPAIAVLRGSGTGLSGATSVHVVIIPVKKRFDGLGS